MIYHSIKFRPACATAIIMLLAVATFAQTRTSFNDGWLFQRDDPPGIEGAISRESVKSWALDPRPGLGTELAYSNGSHDDTAWQQLDLPHDWAIRGDFDPKINGEAARLPTAGIGWYRKHFTVRESDAGKRIYIDFDGAMSHSSVWLNGRYVGGWPFGYASFRLDLTPYVEIGKDNVIAVRLDNPPDSSRWYTGAGIYRNVWLVKTDPVHVAHWGTYITTPSVSKESAEINARVSVDNRSSTVAEIVVKTSIYGTLDGNLVGSPVAWFADQGLTLAANTTRSVDARLELSEPKLWSTQTPDLYVAVTNIEHNGQIVDTYETSFGIRTIAFDAENGFLLNGERVYLKGVCQHHDLGAIGAAFNLRALERQFDILQEMGVNAIRTSHNPHAPELLDLADRRGILILDEAFDAWVKGKRKNDYSTLFADWHERDLRSFIRRDRNHPSVIMWSTGNEIYEQTPDGHAVSAKLTRIVHEEDPTRPVTAAANMAEAGYNGFQKTVDVFGYNYKPYEYGRFRRANPKIPIFSTESSSTISSRGEYFFPVPRGRSGGMRDFQATSDELISSWLANIIHEGKRQRRRVVREFYQPYPKPVDGSPAALLARGEYFYPVLEEMLKGYANFQVSSYDQHRQSWATLTDTEFAGQDRHPFVAGEFVWTGFDYLGETNPFDGIGATPTYYTDPEVEAKVVAELKATRKVSIPQRSSYFGVIDLCGFKKDRFYLYQARWRPDLPMAHILPHWNWPERVGLITPVHVYTSGDEAELFLNGRSLGRKKRAAYQYRFRWDDVVYEKGELKVVVYKNGEPWAEDTVRTTGPATQVTMSADRSEIRSDASDLSFVTVSISDRNGVTVPRSKQRINFEISGPGEIVAIDNGDATDLDPFYATTRRAFNGLALVIVRTKKNAPGKILLKATSNGLRTASVEVISK